MSIPPFTQGYPPDGSSLGQTKVAIRQNLDGTFLTLGTDHVNNNGIPGSNPAGYHTIIHQTLQSTDPAPISNVNQIYSKNYTTPAGTFTQLFTRNSDMSGGGAGISQLTGTNSTTQGWQWIGGVLLQWGIAAISGTSPITGTVDFLTRNGLSSNGINFPTVNGCFNVTTGFSGTAVSNTSMAIVTITGVSETGFTWAVNRSSSSAANAFYWVAIGN